MTSAARVLSAIAALAILASQPAYSQTFVEWNGVAGNWEDPSKWLTGTLPSRDFDEIARIDSGGIATVHTALADTSIGGFSANPAGVLLGDVAGTGEVVVSSGGTFRVQAGSGPAIPGNFIVGAAPGTGTLRVLPGGSLKVDGALNSGVGQLNLVQLGAGTGSGVASVQTGTSSFQGLTTSYPNATFHAATTINLGASGVYRPVINGANAATLIADGGPVTLGGTLRPDFGGGTPALGSSWKLVEGSAILGGFSNIDRSLTGALGPGQSLIVRTVDAPAGRKAAQLEHRQVAVLNVNRDTGVVSLANPGAVGVTLDGYTISSNGGLLDPAPWNSLQIQGNLGGGWRESPAPGTVNRLSELKRTSGQGTLAPGAQVSLGNIYDAIPTGATFGSASDDLAFTFTTTDGVIPGIVNYTGTKFNSLLLQVDPANGEAQLRNTSETTVQIDGYTVTSAGGLSIDPVAWNSLDEQNAAGGDWADSPGTTARISELKKAGATTLAPGTSFSLGGLFNEAQPRDLAFQFLLSGSSTPLNGVVLYSSLAAAGIPGDFDNNGVVNSVDLAQWKGSYGVNGGADADNDGDSDGADFLTWQRNFGRTSAVASAAAVPEPHSLLLVAICLASVASLRPMRAAWLGSEGSSGC